MLAVGVLCVCISAASLGLTYAQQTRLPLDQTTSLTTQTLPDSNLVEIPANTNGNQELWISIALCSAPSGPSPVFLITNDTIGTRGFQQVPLINGLGLWQSRFADGGLLSVGFEGAEEIRFQVGVSTRPDPIHKVLDETPFLGDTTSNQALVFSHTFFTSDLPPEPKFPNYTLPAANLSQPERPLTVPTFSLLLTPTSQGVARGPHTVCFLTTQTGVGTVAEEKQWARDAINWRNQWLIAGLTPSTNYTVFVTQDGHVGGPIYFATKSAGFPCPLVHSLPYCPSVSYAVALPQPPAPDTVYTDANLPSEASAPVLSYMTNFTTVLTTFACGRDWYSPLMGCDDCQREYRKWLCAISFTRCSEPSPDNPFGFTATPPSPTATGGAASLDTAHPNAGQKVMSALMPVETRDAPRNPLLPPIGAPYMMLQPCLEQCNMMDRACPPFVGIKCPTNSYNAAASYGVGYIDSAGGDKDGGLTGRAQDRYGNVWCQLLD